MVAETFPPSATYNETRKCLGHANPQDVSSLGALEMTASSGG